MVNRSRRSLPRLPYRKAAEHLLGKHYDLEVIVLQSSSMKAINKTYRGKETTTNVLSFALERGAGQLLLDPAVIAKEAVTLGMSPKAHLWNVYLHSLLHIKGFRHGARMERALKQLSRFCERGSRKA